MTATTKWAPLHGFAIVGCVQVGVDDDEGRVKLHVPHSLMAVRCANTQCQELWPVSRGVISSDHVDEIGAGFDFHAIACATCGQCYPVEVP